MFACRIQMLQKSRCHFLPANIRSHTLTCRSLVSEARQPLQWAKWTTNERDAFALSSTGETVTDPFTSDTSDTGPVFQSIGEKADHNERQTGLLYKLPHVAVPDEHIASAVKRARRVGRNKKLVGPSAQARNLATRQMDKLMKELTLPLTTYLKKFPVVDRLHEFEAALLHLTISEERYYKVLAKVLQLRKTATNMGKEFASRCAKAENKKDVERIAEEGFATMESFFFKNKGALIDLVDIARKLRQLPKLDLNVPTIALVGAPNVGKSSLVQAISSGKPEICNYPFTTRNIKMGHFYVNSIRHQVTDTPGLLNRPEEDKNAMELLTMATLRHLPTAVIFVIDATEDCGSSIDDQLAIRSHLKNAFPSKLWIDVFSKADLLQDAIAQTMHPAASESGKESKQARVLRTLPEAIKISCVTEQGIDTFKTCIINSLTETRRFV